MTCCRMRCSDICDCDQSLLRPVPTAEVAGRGMTSCTKRTLRTFRVKATDATTAPTKSWYAGQSGILKSVPAFITG